MNTTGLILLAHGSRNPHWQAPFENLLKELQAEFGADRVYLAFLQMATPRLAEVVRDLAAQGQRTLRILPVLLSAGSHAEGDIPSEVAALRILHPSLTLEILPPLISQPRFKTLMRDWVKDSL